MTRKEVLKNVSTKELTAGVIWIIIGAIQIIVGISLIRYYWITIIVGIWNLINGILRINNASKIEERANTLVEIYEKNITNIIIFIVLNIFIGGLIGVIGAVFDIITRNYVLTNKDIINGIIKEDSVANTSNISKYNELEKIMELKQKGILTEDEFNAEKSKILK